MKTNEVIKRIKECIEEAHSFSKGLGESNSIHLDYLISRVSNPGISSTDIHIALLEMKSQQEIEFGENNIIIITKNYNIKPL